MRDYPKSKANVREGKKIAMNSVEGVSKSKTRIFSLNTKSDFLISLSGMFFFIDLLIYLEFLIISLPFLF